MGGVAGTLPPSFSVNHPLCGLTPSLTHMEFSHLIYATIGSERTVTLVAMLHQASVRGQRKKGKAEVFGLWEDSAYGPSTTHRSRPWPLLPCQ